MAKKKSLLGRIVDSIRKLFGKKKAKKKRRKNVVRKIYKTTDGYFTDNSKIKKNRRVAVVEQRKDDGALAVAKIYKKEGKSGTLHLEKPVLKPKKHPSLTEDSLVGSQVFFGRKGKDKQYKIIESRDLEDTGDKLTRKEHKLVMKNVHNDTPKHRATYEATAKKWRNHFTE